MKFAWFKAKVRVLVVNARLFTARLARKKIVVFYCTTGSSFCFMESIWRETVKFRGVCCWLAIDERSARNTIPYLLSRGVPERDILCVASAYSLKNVDVFLSPFGDMVPDCKCARIQLFHGLAGWGCSKSSCTDPLMISLVPFNHLFMTGPNQAAILKGKYFDLHPEVKDTTYLYEVGYPKTDSLINGTYSRDSVVAQYKLDRDRPIVLYAPTWENDASLNMYGEEILDALASLDATVLVKLHPLFMRKNWPRKDGLQWCEVLSEFFLTHPNCHWIDAPDANSLLVAADVLVTDVSGIGFEYLLLNKPIIYYDSPEFFASSGTTGIEYWGRSGGEIVKSGSELLAAVQRAMADPKRFSLERESLVNQIVYHRGSATAQAVKVIRQLCG